MTPHPPSAINGLMFLELRFICLRPIRNLPHFHGPQWYGLLRPMKNHFLPGLGDLAQSVIWIHPVETGVCAYAPDDPIHLGLTFPEIHGDAMSRLLLEFNRFPAAVSAHFQPGRTIRLDSIQCRVSGREFPPEAAPDKPFQPAHDGLLEPEIAALARMPGFSIRFSAPLRCKRPPDMKRKTTGHNFMDPEFFLGREFSPAQSFHAFVRSIHPETPHAVFADSPSAVTGALTFLDNAYGNQKTPLGGVMGQIRVTGFPGMAAARKLSAGQYLGAGKSRAFGLGFFEIPELSTVRSILPLTRGKTLISRAAHPAHLANALQKLPNSAPGADGIAKSDLLKAGEEAILPISRSMMEGAFSPGPSIRYRHPKKTGGFREVCIQNYTDRLVHRAIADTIAPAADTILSRSAYAFRKGLNRQGGAKALKDAMNEGYTAGVKTDISAFFDSVDLAALAHLLDGLFSRDPLPGFVIRLIRHINDSGPPGSRFSGLPQGSPLSPVLSNLFLDRFDKFMVDEGFRLVRYSDDLAVLFQPERTSAEACRDLITQTLADMGLSVSPDKTASFSSESGLRFLGFKVTAENVLPDPAPKVEEEKPWEEMFRPEWASGYPVYLSSICRGAYAAGPHLVVQYEEDRKETIPFNRISRMVVVGRSSFSGGVVYRAVKEGIPVSFLDVMGRYTGQLMSGGWKPPLLQDDQKRMSADPVFCLEFARNLIAAQMHNRMVLLRRNKQDPSDLKDMIRKAEQAESLEALRGYEGSGARMYFEHFKSLTEPFLFSGRLYHPPPDPVNAMLSFGYTLLRGRLAGALIQKGFHIWTGFYHQERSGHDALVSDLLEEVRHVSERMVLSLIHKKEITPEEFETITIKGQPACRFKGSAFRAIVHRFESIMALESVHDGGEKMSMNACLDEMADRLRRCLKLTIPYRPMRIR